MNLNYYLAQCEYFPVYVKGSTFANMIIRLSVFRLIFFGLSRDSFVCFLVKAFCTKYKVPHKVSAISSKDLPWFLMVLTTFFLFFSTKVISSNLKKKKKIINKWSVFYSLIILSLFILKQMYLLAIFFF